MLGKEQWIVITMMRWHNMIYGYEIVQQALLQKSNHMIIIQYLQVIMAKQKKNSSSQALPLFIEKLCNILEDQQCTEYIEWTTSDDAFNIKDINRFTDVVLPKYFKHSNFSSFIRQLNMYGFSKVRHQDGENVYKNDNFKRYSKNLLRNIKRKINAPEKEDKLIVYTPTNNLNRQLNQLKSKQRNLQGMCKQLIAQNSKILEENNLMMKKLSADRKEKNQKMEQLLVSLIMARGNNQLALPNSENSRMLSLANQGQPDYSNNLEAFRQFLEDTHGMDRLQQALKNYQSDEKKRNKSKTYTIVKNGEEEMEDIKVENNGDESHLSLGKKASEHENSMLSLGDFLNFEEPENPTF